MEMSMLEKNFISVVVYIRNQESYIEKFFCGLTDILKENFSKFEIILVDDYSNDHSTDLVRKLAAETKGISISIVHLSYVHGCEAAMLAGVDMAIGDFVFEFDNLIVDYDFSEVMNVYRMSLQGYDVVGAAPEQDERLTSKVFYKIFKYYSKNNIQLTTEKFRILSRRGINRIMMLSNTIAYRKAIYYNCGLKTTTIKYSSSQFAIQSSAFANRERVDLAITTLLLFTNMGSRLALYMSSIMLLISLFMIGYTLCIYLTYTRVTEGWTTLMLFLSVAFTGVFALLSILIKYVSIILSMQQKKQAYVFESVEKLKQ